MPEPDRWSRWLLERRDGASDEQRAATLARLARFRDRVLDNAEPLAGATLLDVGTGDGLIGRGALERVGPDGGVIFADVSEALLAEARAAVQATGASDRSRFVRATAEDLAPIADASVDVITTRSVLIYVVDKAASFAAFHRVLRPCGRISLFEPINSLMFPEPPGHFWGYDLTAVPELVEKVSAVFTASLEPSARDAMTGFDDRDLARFAHEAGFANVHVECHIDVVAGGIDPPVSLDALLDGAPNPNAPTTREAIDAVLTVPEGRMFTEELSRAFAERRTTGRLAIAYVIARKR